MIELVYSPQWFYGKDIIIDIVSIFVLFLIGFFAIKCYRMNKKNKNYLLLAISFFTLAASFIFKILTNFTIYYKIIEIKNIGVVTLTYQTIKSTNTLFFIGFMLYRILTLIGLYILYSIYTKQTKSNMFLIIFLIIISTYFSQSAYYIFHLTSLILLILITMQYWDIYKKNKLIPSKMLVFSFAIIAISQIIFMFVHLNQLLYVISEIVQLIGYISLLIAFILVLKHGKKR